LLPIAPLAALAAEALLQTSGAGTGRYLSTEIYLPGYAVLLLAAVVACWLVTDARPAFGLVAAVLLMLVMFDLVSQLNGIVRSSPSVTLIVNVLPITIGLVIMLPVAWRLRRQAAPRARALEQGDL
jgi:hypothetical protein